MSFLQNINPAANASYGIVSTIVYILFIIGSWKAFVKAGVAGWKSLIPIYNVYILFKLCWNVKTF